MKKPMLNAIQKARMSMAMKSKNPKMNPGFDSLPKEVQAKIMKKPKLSKSTTKTRKTIGGGTRTVKREQGEYGIEKKTITRKRKSGKGSVKTVTPMTVKANTKMRKKREKETRKKIKKDTKKALKVLKKIDTRPKMAMKKKAKMGMKKAKASQTAGAIMKRERLML